MRGARHSKLSYPHEYVYNIVWLLMCHDVINLCLCREGGSFQLALNFSLSVVSSLTYRGLSAVSSGPEVSQVFLMTYPT